VAGKRRHRDVGARRHHRDPRGFAGDLPQRPDDGENRLPELHRIAHLEPVLDEERWLEEDDRAGRAQEAGRPGRIRLKPPVEGKAALDGVDLDEPADRLRAGKVIIDENVSSRASSPLSAPRYPRTGAVRGAGAVTKRSAPRRPFASRSIACRTFALKEPIETSAAIPSTTESE
jgi:hypothetical protein